MKINRLNESILLEKEIEDYGTGKVSGDDIFDTKCHVPYYDNIIAHPDKVADKYNLKGEIIQMTPEEYYQECADKIFNIPVDKLKTGRRNSTISLDRIRDVIVNHNTRVFLPYINYAEKEQEGLHRMMVAAELFGWDHKFPVLKVTWADEERAHKEQLIRRTEEIEKRIRKAIKDTLRYKFSNDTEVINELEYHMNDYLDDEYASKLFGPEKNFSKDRKIINQEDKFIITCEDAIVELDKSDIPYHENRLPEPDEDIDDVDEEDLAALDLPFDDFVKYMENKYGSNWND